MLYIDDMKEAISYKQKMEIYRTELARLEAIFNSNPSKSTATALSNYRAAKPEQTPEEKRATNVADYNRLARLVNMHNSFKNID